MTIVYVCPFGAMAKGMPLSQNDVWAGWGFKSSQVQKILSW